MDDIEFTLVLSVLVLISLVGNTLVILTVLINKPMQTTLNYLLVNLAVADMVFALSILTRYLIMPFINLPEGQTESILCLVFISFERYFAIIHPLRQRGRFTRRRLKIFIVIGWSVAFLFSIPDFLRAKNYHSGERLCKNDSDLDYAHMSSKVNGLLWMILAGIVPVTTMVCLYTRVVHHLWFKPVQNLESSQRAALRYRKQVTITLISVSVIYTVCWSPNLAAYFIEYWSKYIPWMDKTGTVLLTFNSCVNPLVYSMRIKSFRDHLRDMLSCTKTERTKAQTAEMRARPTTSQPDTMASTPQPLASAFKQEMATTKA